MLKLNTSGRRVRPLMALVCLASLTQSQTALAAVSSPTTLAGAVASQAGLALGYGISEALLHYLDTQSLLQADDTGPADTQASSTGLPSSVTLSASPNPAQPGDQITLTWQSDQAVDCVASGGWQGAKPPSGSQLVGPVTQNQQFDLSCSNAYGGSLASTEVVVTQDETVNVTLNVSSTTVKKNNAVELTWQAEHADYCMAENAWQGELPVRGTFTTLPLTAAATFQITCFRNGESAVAMASVAIEDRVVLSWRAPTRNEDGSPITGIVSYNIYWGSKPGEYSDVVSVPGEASEWQANLLPGTYYFAMSTIDQAGVESELSPEVLVPVN